jgi:hypothetical protein
MADDDSERRMNLLIHRLPASFQKPARWLRIDNAEFEDKRKTIGR